MKDSRILPLMALALTAALTAAGCSDSGEASDVAESSSSSTTSTRTSETSSAESDDSTETASTSTTSSTDTRDFKDASIGRAYEKYGDLAPRELFEQLNDCQPNGLPNSITCTGPKVGTFQFMSSKPKSMSVMQALTEFSNSQVVDKSEDRVVGWSIMGTTAIVTVVNKDKGLILQQMVSTDDVDPEERIYELGLAEKPGTAESEPTEPEEQDSDNAAAADDEENNADSED
ncbi:hypothetical protein [Corynebacterium sp. TAE3-ERU2]|uniref:hypothetical protein n=1 Tax=Corynebacterium sp. TAE3-ERU2 TaxID=2849497 RepID=UPI001C46B5F0|nr:hypothetical protein [Corynebacterium sp. TAE3-ERU2]MBV7302884.1 hypothetical protein [Corynebacterium sp. TAE3-ERU2]